MFHYFNEFLMISNFSASNPGFKVYIGTGATDVNGLGNPGGEVFDLQALSSNCSPLPAFPVTDHGQVGGLYAGKIPMICGGTNSLLCYQLQSNVWVQGGYRDSLKESRISN